ncbi:MAG: carboxylating nicotinate-nucleotide diphosphorylase [Deltaproteobacteria bacterium]|nr:MAG: carboxylating nicotinate-nucleotide diphosphorylase [Deltaproteobacteria bacterium]
MFHIIDLVKTALSEDLGQGDITCHCLIPDHTIGKAQIIAKEEIILGGIDIAALVFHTLDPEITIEKCFNDGERISASEVIAILKGNLTDLLTGERVALNFLQHLSGIATLTHRFVDAVKDYKTKILDTRKTTPGMRTLEKYAVRVGGGNNHRFGLSDGFLIKDNHIRACGGITQALQRAKSNTPFTLKIEVEVKSLEEVEEALEAGAEIVMLDNMNLDSIEAAVSLIDKRAVIEVSGGVTLENVKEIARTGVDYISVGALTHSARAVDISMELMEAVS